MNLLEAMAGYGPDSSVTVSRLAEPIQVEPELLVQLDEGGIRPGAAVSLERVGEYISVRVPGIEGALELPPEVAAHVFVPSAEACQKAGRLRQVAGCPIDLGTGKDNGIVTVQA